MKKFLSVLLVTSIVAGACNNEASDSVEKADSANEAKIDSPAAVPSQTITADEATASFLVRAANGGMAEVEFGQLAQQKAVNADVKQFAGMMSQDHSGVNAKVKSFASVRNVTLPAEISDEYKKKKEDLNKKTGKDFDKAYMKDMVKDHEDDIKEFEKAADKVGDVEVKNFINSTLPTLRTHLDSAKAIQKRLK